MLQKSQVIQGAKETKETKGGEGQKAKWQTGRGQERAER